MKLHEAYPYSYYYFLGGVTLAEIEDYIPRDDTSEFNLVTPSAEWWYWISLSGEDYYESLLETGGVSNFYLGEDGTGLHNYRYPDVESKYKDFDKFRRTDEHYDSIVFQPNLIATDGISGYTKEQIIEWADYNCFLVRPIKAPLLKKLVGVFNPKAGQVTQDYWDTLQEWEIGLELIRILPTPDLFCRYIWLNTQAEYVTHLWHHEGVKPDIWKCVIKHLPLYQCVFMGDTPYKFDEYCLVDLEYREWLRGCYYPLKNRYGDYRRGAWADSLDEEIVTKLISI